MHIPSIIILVGGFQLYDNIHLGWLLGIGLFIFLLTMYYRQAREPLRSRIRQWLASIILVMEIVKDIYHIVRGTFSFYYLPLHLCSLAIFIIFWHAFRSNSTNKEMLYALVLPGALAALIFPEWTTTAIYTYLHHLPLIQDKDTLSWLQGEPKEQPSCLRKAWSY